jgi:hypothetical protein
MGPTQSPTNWIPGVLSPWVKQPGREADHKTPSTAKVKNTWRRLHNEELHNLYASLNIIKVIKSKRMGRAYEKCTKYFVWET